MTNCSNKVTSTNNNAKVSNASLGSMLSNKFAMLKRVGGCDNGKKHIVYSSNTVTHDTRAKQLNKELATLQREYGACYSIDTAGGGGVDA